MLAAFLFHGGCSLQATLYWTLSSQAQVDHHIKFLTLLWILSSQAQVYHHIKFLTLLLDLYRRPINLFRVFFFEFLPKTQRSYCDLEFLKNFFLKFFLVSFSSTFGLMCIQGVISCLEFFARITWDAQQPNTDHLALMCKMDKSFQCFCISLAWVKNEVCYNPSHIDVGYKFMVFVKCCHGCTYVILPLYT